MATVMRIVMESFDLPGDKSAMRMISPALRPYVTHPLKTTEIVFTVRGQF